MHPQPIVLVTGGNRGIGFEICRQLLQRGANVVFTARTAESVDEALAKLASSAPRLTGLVADVRDDHALRKVAEHINEVHGKLDVLINNAGINVDGGSSIGDVTPVQMRETFETNTIAPLRATQLLLPLLRKAAPARVINISSSMASTGNLMAGYPAYRVAKMALNSVTIQLSAVLAQEKIAVNSVCPGWVQTDLGGPHAPLTVEQGADTPVWLALDAPQALTGKFVSQRATIPW